MEEKKTELKKYSTFEKIIMAMAVLAVASICVHVAGYKAIGTMMVRVAIVVDVGAAMVVGLEWLRKRSGESE